MKTSLICAGLLALHCGAVAGQERGAVVKNDGDYDKAYAIGVAEAEKQLKARNATLYTFGLLDRFEHLDRETGLPYEEIAGCVVDNAILGRAAGHDDRIMKSIADKGLPSHSFKRWEKDLFDLKGYYEKRVKTAKPLRLTLRGPYAKSSDGKYTLRLVKSPMKKKDGTPSDRWFVGVSVDEVDREPTLLSSFETTTDVDVFWGPTGSGFAVIRWQGKTKSRFLALDMRRGRALREEWFRRVEPSK